MKNFYKKGFTLIEVLIVIAIVGLLIAIVLPKFSKIRENQVFKGAILDTISSINKAKGETLSSISSSEYGVHFQSDKVIIFKGKVFSSGASDNETIIITSPASITNVTLGGVSGTSGAIYFNRLTGAPSATGTITIATSNYSKIVTISATGSASSN
ncbi:MAG: type II secretion system protein [Candidatus Paceibacterota bacterium]